LLVHKDCRKSIEVAERYADGKVTDGDLTAQLRSAYRGYQLACFAQQDYPTKHKGNPFARLPVEQLRVAVEATEAVMGTVDPVLGNEDREEFSVARIVELVVTASNGKVTKADAEVTLVREIFGNPFHPVTLHQTWLTSDVLLLARGIYKERAFDRMPILADALQDAGCDSNDILSHCRGPGPHVRGCWVVDLVLGKE
jgi:hypothetical protein